MLCMHACVYLYINIYSFIFILYKYMLIYFHSDRIGSDGIGSTASEGAEDSYETLKELWVLLGVSCCRKAARLVLGT